MWDSIMLVGWSFLVAYIFFQAGRGNQMLREKEKRENNTTD